MECYFNKSSTGLVPANEEAQEWFDKQKIGSMIKGNFTKKNNPAFHRKMFKLLDVGFEYWEPGEINSKYGTPEKNFKRYRKDLTILAGFYEVYIRLDGSTRVEAQSLSFDSMEHEEREKVYNAFIGVILKHIMNDMPKEDFQRILNFA